MYLTWTLLLSSSVYYYLSSVFVSAEYRVFGNRDNLGEVRSGTDLPRGSRVGSSGNSHAGPWFTAKVGNEPCSIRTLCFTLPPFSLFATCLSDLGGKKGLG